MLAPKVLPARFQEWNERHHAPFGRQRASHALQRLLGRRAAVIRYIGPYGWQTNTTLRAFEYPWAFEQIGRLGRDLCVVEVGAGLAGLQFSLARAGHQVHAVDPGLASRGRGWEIDPEFHTTLGAIFEAPVPLHPGTLASAGFGDESVDVVLSVSTLEHFAREDLAEFEVEARRIVRPGGHLVLTIDLFLDLDPFTSRPRNRYGRNVDISLLLEACDAELIHGQPAELLGFPGFDAERVQSNLSAYQIGEGYPALAQCLVARRR